MGTEITEAVRGRVTQRANFRCEYCHIHEADAGFALQLDHVISRKHGGSSEEGNLALACVLCNRYKGSDIAAIDGGEAVLLFHPRQDRWEEHFRLREGMIEPLTRCGRVTISLLRMNTLERIAERKMRRLGGE